MSAADTSPPEPAPKPQGGGTIHLADGPFLRFPPFPKAPAGTTIMPFKDFKEGGIRVDPGPDDEEVDNHGIPTVPLNMRPHATNVCKTNTKRKRRAEDLKARKKAGMSTQRIWWEQWDDTETVRFSIGFNPNSSRFERLHAAAGDFTTGRSWPLNFPSETGPKFIWDKFQQYLGIPQGSTVPQDSKKKETEEDDDDDDDVSDGGMSGDDDDGSDQGVSGNAGVVKDRDLAATIAKEKTVASNEEKLSLFFNSPERSFRVFLSSYAHEKGYIWSDLNLDCMPRVLLYFANFLLRSKVLPEIERSLRRSVDVIKLAITELSNTSNIGKAFPDNFSQACNACWGKKADGYMTFALDEVEVPAPYLTPDEANEKPAVQNTADNLTNGNPWKTDVEAPPWVPEDGNVWDIKPEDEAALALKDAESWLNTGADEKSLLEFLGPTTLPLTHKPGIVERSARRIKAIIPPNPNPPKSASQAEGVSDADAEAVEVDLDRLFAKLVLSPMPVDWDGDECPVYSRPLILATSRGAVVGEGASAIPEGSTGPKPHNPLEDDITVLIEPKESTISLLLDGICIGGTWVQIARQGEVVKKKKGKSKKAAPNYWYLDEHALTVPSFWTIPVPPADD